MPETVVHAAGDTTGGLQRCLDCGRIVGGGEIGVPAWKRGQLVGVRVDPSFKDGVIVGFFRIGRRALEPDERRCSTRSGS